MARTIKPKQEQKPQRIYQNCGGHMINPPDECEQSVITPDGAKWVDTNRCINCAGCERWIAFEKLGSMAKFKDAESHGVIIEWGWFRDND